MYWHGGGSLLRGLDQLISMETNMPVYVCEEPLSAVALGTGRRFLENIDVLKSSFKEPPKKFTEEEHIICTLRLERWRVLVWKPDPAWGGFKL